MIVAATSVAYVLKSTTEVVTTSQNEQADGNPSACSLLELRQDNGLLFLVLPLFICIRDFAFLVRFKE
jgi:hypothetical protein